MLKIQVSNFYALTISNFQFFQKFQHLILYMFHQFLMFNFSIQKIQNNIQSKFTTKDLYQRTYHPRKKPLRHWKRKGICLVHAEIKNERQVEMLSVYF